MAVASSIEKALANETVDALVWRVLRKGASAVEQVFLANPNLADHGLFLPFGLPVVIPGVASGAEVRPQINLWD